MKKIFLFGALSFSVFTNAQALKYPKILEWQGSPIIEFINNKKAILKKDQPLKNSFVVVTANDDEVQLQFSYGEKITIQAKSRIQVPQVSPDTGEANELFIFDGVIHYKSDVTESESKLKIKSAFFDLKLPAVIDAIVSIDKKKPSTKFLVVKGELSVTFLDFEKTVVIKSGEAVTFTGEKDESGNVKYDYFLEGKKAPHGRIEEIEKVDISAYFEKEKEVLKAKAAVVQNKKAIEALKKKKLKKYLDSFLCHEPLGQRDECYWKSIEKKCFRFRCNVSGQWGDETERPQIEKCNLPAAATACDY
ncbi:MAG: hypothetical protein WA160_13240 [Pseudobdellovibrio sp.]